MLAWYELGWIFSTLFCLIIASYFDLKDRIIPDTIWLLQFLLGFIFDIGWIMSGPNLLEIIIATSNLILASVLILASIFLGILAGGDLKAVAALSISYPQLVLIFKLPISSLDLFPPLFSIIIYFWICYLILALAFLFYNIRYNLKEPLFADVDGTSLEKFLILFEGIKVDREYIATHKHYNVAEKWNGNEWSLYTPRFERQLTDEEYEVIEKQEKQDALRDMGATQKSTIWIRPQIPGVPSFLIGFLLTIIFGSVVDFLF